MTDQSPKWVAATLTRIKTSLIKHSTFELSYRRLLMHAETRLPGECMALAAPSRNGKTTLLELFQKELNPSSEEDWMKSRPVVLLTCRNRGDRGVFSTKIFLQDALKEIGHPMYVRGRKDLLANHRLNRRLNKETNAVLGNVLEDTLGLLDTKYLVIDETHHLKYVQGGTKTALQMLESFKTLAAEKNLVLIFVGAYPMLNILNLSTHMLGRSTTIDMPRYRLNDAAGLESFESLLAWFSEGIRFADGVESLRDWNYALYEETLGVIGLLSSWVRGALAEMAARDDSALAWEHMEHTRPPARDRQEILEEIVVGEDYLGIDSTGDVLERDRMAQAKSSSRSRTVNRKPFEQKPTRRPTGARS